MLKTRNKQISKDGTVKFLFELADGNLIETVLMRQDYGNSVCVSSQVGCSMGCVFCASGLLKKVRDLTAEEMLAQVFAAQEFLQQNRAAFIQPLKEQTKTIPEQITHIVVMGTGEPFDNYDEVLRFCDAVSEKKRLSEAIFRRQEKVPLAFSEIAPRHITVSTCGLVPKIPEFAKTAKRYNLAISLHAPDDEIRNRLMPVNKRYPVAEVIRAAKEYCEITGRRVTFEYLLLKGINDSAECAQKLAELLQSSRDFYVNLIPWNPVNVPFLSGISKEQALAFYDILMKNGIKATLRKERGTDIAAACGQLRAQAGKQVPHQT